MRKIFIDSIINLIFLSILIYASSFFISKIQLSVHYHKANIPSPSLLSTWQTGSVGFVSYRNSLNIGITEEGLYLSFVFLTASFPSTFINTLECN